MRKFFKRAYVLLLVLVCASPLVLTPLFGESESAEKRDLSEFPALIEDGALNLSFASELDTWITEHFCFRSELITANNVLKAEVFATSDEDQVIVGKDDWLYFSETADDYLGLNRLTDGDIARLAAVVDLMDEYVTGKGGRFVFAVAPNKNTVYPDYMPDYYRRTQEATNLQRLTETLKGRPYFADLLGALQGSGETAYHARDSHWNNLGALTGYNAILDAAGREHETYAGASWHWERTWDGDLDAMIFPSLGYKDRQAVFDVDWTYAYTSNFHSEEDLLITTENPEGEGSLLIFRDSFANALLPFLAQEYGSAKFSRAVPYTLYELEETPYDTVVLEIVERNLRNLLTAAPAMPAPSRTLDAAPQAAGSARVETREYAGYLHVYGALDGAAAQDAAPIYLKLEKDGETRYVEAFPVYESALLDGEGETAVRPGGFSAYLPAEDADGAAISVVVPANGGYAEYTAA